MSSTAKLYTPQVLALATALADYPLESASKLRGSTRSTVCGSALDLTLDLDGAGRIAAVGMKAHACAVGQAAAALFAQGASGRSQQDIAKAAAQIGDWLQDGQATLPDWPGIEQLAAARDYPGRHEAILLPWKAALAMLP